MRLLRQEKYFFLLLFLFLILRFGTLLTSVEYVSWDEELYRGTVAKELIEGLKVPLWDYQADGYDGGSLAVAILAVPFFLLFGPNLFALKLVPLCFSFGTLIFTYMFLKKFFDRKAALLACAILTLSPPVWTGLSLSAIGSHPESVFFSSAMLYCFYSFLFGQKQRETLWILLFGLVSGVGCWFTSITGITLMACLISWVILERKSFFSRTFFLFSGAFFVGALPALAYNSQRDFGLVEFFRHYFLWGGYYDTLAQKLASVPVRFAKLVLEVLPSIFRFHPFLGIPRTLFILSYGLVAWFLIGSFIWKKGRGLFSARFLPLVLFPVLFVAIYSASNFPLRPVPESFVGYRYFSPLYYFLFLLAALSASFNRRSAVIVALIVLGLMGQVSLLLNEPWGKALHYKGYNYRSLGGAWAQQMASFPEKFEQFQTVAARFEGQPRRQLYWGNARLLGWVRREDVPEIVEMEKDPSVALKAIHRVPAEYRSYFLEEWGRHLSYFTPRELDRNQAFGALLSSEEAPYFYYGFFTITPIGARHSIAEIALGILQSSADRYQKFHYFNLGRSLYWESEWFQADHEKGRIGIGIPDLLGAEERTWLYRGLGAEAATFWVWSGHFDRNFESRLKSHIPPTARVDFFWGIGWGVSEWFIQDRPRARDWLMRLPPEGQPAALEGFRAYGQWYQCGDA